MRRHLLPILAIPMLAIPATVSAQIVNTLGGWDDDAQGVSGEIGATVSLTGGNTDVQSITGSFRLQWQSGTDRLRATASGRFAESSGIRIQESSFAHLRHNRRILSWLRSIGFVQAQRDPFQRLDTRMVVGAGARLDLLRRPTWVFSIGVTPMLEYESLTVPGTKPQTRVRLSQFIRLRANLDEHSTLELHTFAQPDIDDPDNFRSIGSGSIRSRVVGQLSLVLVGSHVYNSEPAAGVKKEDWSVESGLAFSF